MVEPYNITAYIFAVYVRVECNTYLHFPEHLNMLSANNDAPTSYA